MVSEDATLTITFDMSMLLKILEIIINKIVSHPTDRFVVL
jgi:hypothetical protein